MRQLSGQRAWILQRLSALALLAATVAAGLFLLAAPAPDYQGWLAFVRHPWGAILILAVAAALCAHGWVGARDVVLDYVHRPALRLPVLVLAAAVLAIIFLRILVTVVSTLAGAP